MVEHPVMWKNATIYTWSSCTLQHDRKERLLGIAVLVPSVSWVDNGVHNL